MTWVLAVSLLGGIGLFLLGMTMLTDGLKLAAGRALERILAHAREAGAWVATREQIARHWLAVS